MNSVRMIRIGGIILLLSLFTMALSNRQTTFASTDSIEDKIDQEVFDTIREEGEAELFVMMDTSPYNVAQQGRSRYSQQQMIQTQIASVATHREQLLNRMSAEEYEPIQQFQSVPAVVGRILSEDALLKIASDPAVQRISLNEGGGTVNLAESVPLIGADISYNNGYTGKGVTVAVIDTGFDSDHPALAGRLVAEACFLGLPHCPNGTEREFGPGSAEDTDTRFGGHGTFVTGIIASNGAGPASRGVAPNVNIVAIRVMDDTGRNQSSFDIVAALDYIFTDLPDVKIINMSFGTNQQFSSVCDNEFSWTQALAFSAQQLTNRGTLLIAGTGNDHDADGIDSPSCISSILSVSASTKQDTHTSFGNSSRDVDLVAPGIPIVSLSNTGGIRSDSGTSFSVPHVAGCAALLVESGITNVHLLKERLKQSDVQITNSRNGLTFPRLDCEIPSSTTPPGVQPCPVSGVWPKGCVPGIPTPEGNPCPPFGVWPKGCTPATTPTPTPMPEGNPCPPFGVWPKGCTPPATTPTPTPIPTTPMPTTPTPTPASPPDEDQLRTDARQARHLIELLGGVLDSSSGGKSINCDEFKSLYAQIEQLPTQTNVDPAVQPTYNSYREAVDHVLDSNQSIAELCADGGVKTAGSLNYGIARTGINKALDILIPIVE